uniref:Prolyl oligopeptidase A n=1 Tax=Amanita bisporigera TaxID=87325 RepID=POPA_AMABI|nr:RecName: Full=Prolyl oligopeptidase A [Amanita bisporigera]ADN19204.1 prolyl oligopeptidase [Amanita bisporigera]
MHRFLQPVRERLRSALARYFGSRIMSSTQWTPNMYPSARRSDHIDTYRSETRGEVKVPDPYHWLEEYSEETDKWTSDQEEFTRTYLDSNPDRKKLEDAFRKSMDYPKFSAPFLNDDKRWYWFYNTGLQAQTVICRSKDETLPDFSESDYVGETFFDPNLLSSDGTASLSMYDFSHCGKYFAYGISLSGSDFSTIYVRSTSSPLAPGNNSIRNDDGRLPDELRYVKFSSISWTKDSKGFFYQRYPGTGTVNGQNGIQTQGDRDAMIYYHRIGTSQSDDILVHEDQEHPDWVFGAEVTEDGKYVALYTMKDTSRKNLLWIADLGQNEVGRNMKWNKICNVFDSEYDLIGNDGSLLYIRTNKAAPQYKIVTLDIEKPELGFKEFIPEDPKAYLSQVKIFNKDRLALVYKRNVIGELYVYNNTGSRLMRLARDFVGSMTVTARETEPWFFATLTGFNTPGIVCRYNIQRPEEQRWSVYRTAKVKGLNPNDFEARQVWYDSYDGTKIPMFIVRHKNTQFNGTAPAIQYGYGGFNISINPFFSPTILTFLQKYGAILAVPNIRGGGEFGETWHDAGIREKRANVYDDFIAATQFLVKNKYAAGGKVAINGGSNGGLLVAACVNRAREGTFGAAIAEVGVLDLLKFPKFTIGKAWISDYGDPEDPRDFDYIYTHSPLHNIPKNMVLPPTMLLTADHDDRVVPMHSFKYAAMLQYTLPHNRHPLLLRVDKKAGHGGGKSTEKRLQEAADKWGFAAQSMGLAWKDRQANL